MGGSRSHGPLLREQGLDNWVASVACPQQLPLQRSRRRGRGSHAHDELFSKHIEPEPAPEDPMDWAMAEASDDEDDVPMPDAPPEPEVIDMPPAPASHQNIQSVSQPGKLRIFTHRCSLPSEAGLLTVAASVSRLCWSCVRLHLIHFRALSAQRETW